MRQLPPDWNLLRYCSVPVQVVPDKVTGGFKFSTQAFRPRRDEGLSVDIEEMRVADGFATSKNIATLRRVIGILRIEVGAVIAEGYAVAHRPVDREIRTLTPPNPYHAEITGDFSKTSKLKRLLALSKQAVPIDSNEAAMAHERLKRLGVIP